MTTVIGEAAGSPVSATTPARSDPTATGASPTEARPIRRRRRVTLGHLLGAVITLAAINGLLGQIGSFRDVGAALARAEWVWIVAALVCCILTFPAAALGVRAGLGVDVPLGPVTALQLSSKFAEAVIPHLRRAGKTIVGLAHSPRRTLVIAGSALAVSTLYAVCSGSACGPTGTSCRWPR